MVNISLNKFLKLIFLFFLLNILFITNLNAQIIEVTAKVDSNNFLIGDWIKLHLNIKYQDGTKITYPAIIDSIEGLELVERSNFSVKKEKNLITESVIFIFTAFDSGMYVIPELKFVYYTEEDTAKKIASTSPIPVFIHKIGVDPTKDIKDIKPPLGIPISIYEILKYILILVLIAALSFGIYYIIKKRKGKNILEVFQTPKRPAHEVALEALQSLEAEHLWQRGEIKLYHSKLTDIIRTYIEDRFQLKAMESTTEEILYNFRNIDNLDEKIIENLKEMLVRADLVKFAKAIPNPDENGRSLILAFDFVKNTIPEEQAEELRK